MCSSVANQLILAINFNHRNLYNRLDRENQRRKKREEEKEEEKGTKKKRGRES